MRPPQAAFGRALEAPPRAPTPVIHLALRKLGRDEGTEQGVKYTVDDAVDCPGEVPAWLMGLCRFLGDLPCWMPRKKRDKASCICLYLALNSAHWTKFLRWWLLTAGNSRFSSVFLFLRGEEREEGGGNPRGLGQAKAWDRGARRRGTRWRRLLASAEGGVGARGCGHGVGCRAAWVTGCCRWAGGESGSTPPWTGPGCGASCWSEGVGRWGTRGCGHGVGCVGHGVSFRGGRRPKGQLIGLQMIKSGLGRI